MKRRFYLQALAALALIWGAVAVAHSLALAAVPSPEKVAAYLAAHPLADAGKADSAGDAATVASRRVVVEEFARQRARLTFVQKRELYATHADTLLAFTSHLSRDEKILLADLTAGPDFNRLIASLAKMPDPDRLRMLERAKRELIDRVPDPARRAQLDKFDAGMISGLIKTAPENVFQMLPPEMKLQMLPFLEQLQNNVRKLAD